MTKSATDVMHEVLVSTVIDAMVALKAASKGLPNSLLRDINAIHANTTFADLPKELQDSITRGVRDGFTRLLKEGYSVSSGRPAPTPRPSAQGPAGRSGEPAARPFHNRPGPGNKPRPRRDGPRPPRPKK
ncbi:MAG: hypothetical protein AB7G25_11905 [Sphingomonadaceae bacterium]